MRIVKERESFGQYLRNKITGKPAAKKLEFYDPAGISGRSAIYVERLAQPTTGAALKLIDEWDTKFAEEDFVFTDYRLEAINGGSPFRLRYSPALDGTSPATIMRLEEVDSLPYTREIHDVFSEAERNGKWIVTLEGEADGLKADETRDIVYRRCNQANTYYHSYVNRIRAVNDTQSVDKNIVQWLDFVRVLDLPGGVSRNEYFFVEKWMDSAQHVSKVVMLKGEDIRPEKVKVV